MKKFLGKSLFLVLALAFVACGVAYATAVTTSWTSSDVREVDYLTPGSVKTQLGTRLRGPLTTGTTTATACNTSGIACNTVATAVTTPIYLKTSSASMGNSIALADGYDNQSITFVLTTDGGKDFVITPTTKTGFTNVTLNDANDSTTLKFGTTTGWVIVGNNGATIN